MTDNKDPKDLIVITIRDLAHIATVFGVETECQKCGERIHLIKDKIILCPNCNTPHRLEE